MIFDITRPMVPAMYVWPGDVPFSLTQQNSIANGDAANVTSLTLSSHTGTHVDAPYHYIDNATTLEALSPDIFLGLATVITVPDGVTLLTPAHLPDLNWANVERLLIHTPASHQSRTAFPEAFVCPSPELADFLGQHEVILFGTDAPSVDTLASVGMPNHQAIGRNNIIILEGLWLADVPDGTYELIALPLKIEGGDGSPVRAILRTLS